ncbi:unnamed protein product [Aphanomyces euteiches]
MSKFPVPNNFFYCPPLGDDEKENLIRIGESSLIDLVRSSKLQDGMIRWEMDSDENGIQIFYGEDPNGPAEVTLLASSTEVLATFDEVAALFRVETAEQYLEYTKLFAKDLLDAAHLYSISSPTENRPRHYTGVRWIVVGSPYPLVANRDYCYLECQDDFEMNGKRGWGRSLTSINLPCCPDFFGTLGTIRATFIRSGFVVLEAKRPGYLKIIHALQTDFKGNIPKWVVKIGMKRRARTIGDIDTYLRERRLSSSPFLREHQLVPKALRSKCYLCQSKFGVLSLKARCRKCGEVVCGKCNKYWEVDTPRGRKAIRVCSACSITGGRDITLSEYGAGVTASEMSGQPTEITRPPNGSKASQPKEDANKQDDDDFAPRESEAESDSMSAYSEYSLYQVGRAQPFKPKLGEIKEINPYENGFRRGQVPPPRYGQCEDRSDNGNNLRGPPVQPRDVYGDRRHVVREQSQLPQVARDMLRKPVHDMVPLNSSEEPLDPNGPARNPPSPQNPEISHGSLKKLQLIQRNPTLNIKTRLHHPLKIFHEVLTIFPTVRRMCTADLPGTFNLILKILSVSPTNSLLNSHKIVDFKVFPVRFKEAPSSHIISPVNLLTFPTIFVAYQLILMNSSSTQLIQENSHTSLVVFQLILVNSPVNIAAYQLILEDFHATLVVFQLILENFHATLVIFQLIPENFHATLVAFQLILEEFVAFLWILGNYFEDLPSDPREISRGPFEEARRPVDPQGFPPDPRDLPQDFSNNPQHLARGPHEVPMGPRFFRDPRQPPRDPSELPRDTRELARDPRQLPHDPREVNHNIREQPRDPHEQASDPRGQPLDPREAPRDIREPQWNSRDVPHRDLRGLPLESRGYPMDFRNQPHDSRSYPIDPRGAPREYGIDPRDIPIDSRAYPREYPAGRNPREYQMDPRWNPHGYPADPRRGHDRRAIPNNDPRFPRDPRDLPSDGGKFPLDQPADPRQIDNWHQDDEFPSRNLRPEYDGRDYPYTREAGWNQPRDYYGRDPRDYPRDILYDRRDYPRDHYPRDDPAYNPNVRAGRRGSREDTRESIDGGSVKAESIQDEVAKVIQALKGEQTPDPKQLLALYKQLQQMNLEGAN